jgi:hypothetical protein
VPESVRTPVAEAYEPVMPPCAVNESTSWPETNPLKNETEALTMFAALVTTRFGSMAMGAPEVTYPAVPLLTLMPGGARMVKAAALYALLEPCGL